MFPAPISAGEMQRNAAQPIWSNSMSDDTTAPATETDETQDDAAETQTEDATDDDSALGDKGKQALDRMKAERATARKEAKDAKDALEKLRAELALKDKPAEEQALEAARAEARAEATQKANERILRADLRAAATGKLADPTDAALYIDLTQFAVSDDGDTDSDALNDAITELIERKPHLALQKQTRFEGGADQGAKGKTTKPPQWTQADLDRARGDHTAIAKAQADGLLDNLLGVKS